MVAGHSLVSLAHSSTDALRVSLDSFVDGAGAGAGADSVAWPTTSR
eukprot:SAG31_NODE_16684_length_700_cov_0.856905_2_plen_45_part_01